MGFQAKLTLHAWKRWPLFQLVIHKVTVIQLPARRLCSAVLTLAFYGDSKLFSVSSEKKRLAYAKLMEFPVALNLALTRQQEQEKKQILIDCNHSDGKGVDGVYTTTLDRMQS